MPPVWRCRPNRDVRDGVDHLHLVLDGIQGGVALPQERRRRLASPSVGSPSALVLPRSAA